MTTARLARGAPTFPVVIDNPPGLSAIQYRVGDYNAFREALLQSVPGETHLQGWQPTEGDLALQLLEWWAYLADILTFYNERIANASYLGTAVIAPPAQPAGNPSPTPTPDPTGAQMIAGAVGFRSRPGVAATGQLGVLVNAVAPVAIPAGFAVQSKPRPGQQPQVFEADAEGVYLPTNSGGAVPIDLFVQTSIQQVATAPYRLLVKGTVTSIKPNDMVVLALGPFSLNTTTNQLDATPYSNATSTAAVVVSVTPEADPRGDHNTRLVFYEVSAPSISTAYSSDVTAFQVLRSVQSVAIYPYTPPNLSQIASVQSQTSSTAVVVLHLASTARAIAVGSLIVVEISDAAPPQYVTAAVADYEEEIWEATIPGVTPPPYPPVVPHSVLTLESLDTATANTIVNNASALRIWYALRVAATPLDEFVPGPLQASAVGSATGAAAVPATPSTPAIAQTPPNLIVPAGTVANNPAFAADYPVLLEGADGVGALAKLTSAPSAQSISLVSTDTTTLVLPLRVLFNVMNVTAGKTVHNEVLGSGDSTVTGQSFALQNAPLTYVAGNDPTFPTSTLQVLVNGIAWTEVTSFSGQSPTARIFVTEQDAHQKTTVIFGDGVHGARLPTGTSNVTANYRYGSGPGDPSLGGPAVASLTTVLMPQPGVGSIRNPVPMTGGAAPSTATQIQASAPASALTFGAAVSARDCEAIALQAPLVSAVRAVFGWNRHVQRATTTLYVAGGADAVTAAAYAISQAVDPNSPVTVEAAVAIPLSVAFVLVYDASYDPSALEPAVIAALTDTTNGPLAFSQTPIGASLYASALHAACLAVPGVIAVRNMTLSAEGTSTKASDVSVTPGAGQYFSLDPSAVDVTPEASHG